MTKIEQKYNMYEFKWLYNKLKCYAQFNQIKLLWLRYLLWDKDICKLNMMKKKKK